MKISQHAGPVLAALIISAALYGSIIVMTPEQYDVTYGGEQGPTPWSADHARAAAKGTSDEAPSTF